MVHEILNNDAKEIDTFQYPANTAHVEPSVECSYLHNVQREESWTKDSIDNVDLSSLCCYTANKRQQYSEQDAVDV